MTRKARDPAAETEQQLGAGIAGQRLARVELARDRADLVQTQAQHLADVANCRPRSIADHLGDHRRIRAAVALVDVLNDELAVLMGEIDVDIGNLAALLGHEALEEQVHPDRIDRGDAERVADRRVRRRAAPLAEHAELAGLAYDVPNDQEVAR